MNIYIQILFLLVGAHVVCRSLALLVTQCDLFSYRDIEYIPRIVHQQKACDVLMIIYYIVTFFIGLWIVVYGGYPLFTDSIEVGKIINLIIPIFLCCLLVVYALIRILFNEAYDLPDYYADMIHYRKAQTVVTEDNDQEVNFIRSYRRVLTMDKCAIVWCFAIIVVAIFI